MHILISQEHTSFIPNWAIQNNIIIAHEAFHFLKTSKFIFHYMAIKVDIQKAYD